MIQRLLRNEAFRHLGRFFNQSKDKRFTRSAQKTVNDAGTSGRIVKREWAMDFGNLLIEQQGATVVLTLKFGGPYEAIVYAEDFCDCMNRGGVRLGFSGAQQSREEVVKG